MANNLETEKKVLAVSMLAEGNSIRSIERVTAERHGAKLFLSMRSFKGKPSGGAKLRFSI
jgi:acyl-CoA thioesterase